jgi:NhaP-type Na+/H+ or K+/H+ antiporter
VLDYSTYTKMMSGALMFAVALMALLFIAWFVCFHPSDVFHMLSPKPDVVSWRQAWMHAQA